MNKLISKNPSKSFEIIGEVEVSTEREIVEKVNFSTIAQKSWSTLSLEERLNKLEKVYDVLFERKDNIATLISKEMGMPISQSKFEVESGLNYFDWYLKNASKYLNPKITYEDETQIHKVYYEARGVIGVMIPWNFPFSIFVRQTIQSLIVGNTVVLKHSKETCLIGKEIEKAFIDGDFTKGVFNEIYGSSEVADILVKQDINMICFTGSTRVGKSLYKIAAEKFIPILMELGGSAPGIVFEDVDIDKTVEIVYNKRFANCGQVCDGLKRLIIHESIFDEFVEKLKNLISTKKVGIAEDSDTDIGPMIGTKQLENLEKQVEDAISKGAKVIIGGNRTEKLQGYFYNPTILTNIDFEMDVWKTEVFGPVLPVVSFKTYDEAIKLANETEYGLGGYVFTKDKELFKKVALQIKTGMIGLNNVSYEIPTNPFGGIKNSGLGMENGEFGFHDVCNIKIVSMEK